VYFPDLQKKITNVEQNLHNYDEISTECRNKIQRLMPLVKQIGLDIMKQNQDTEDFKSSCIALKSSVAEGQHRLPGAKCSDAGLYFATVDDAISFRVISQKGIPRRSLRI
jgi:hypothetical protein